MKFHISSFSCLIDGIVSFAWKTEICRVVGFVLRKMVTTTFVAFAYIFQRDVIQVFAYLAFLIPYNV